MIDDLLTAIVDLREKDAIRITRSMLECEESPFAIMDTCRDAMTIIGEKFERGESFMPELIMGGEILEQITTLVKPHLTGDRTVGNLDKIVIGTVQGDIHDIAKDIVVFMLEINGFEVYDLGVDVPTQTFIEKIIEIEAPILGLSGFLTLALDPMKEVIETLTARGLRSQVKIMIGGGPIDEQARMYTGADAWGKDAMEAVKIANSWV
jgi:5-methyltetrahydrofolate--homocysteine methyltransferase